MNDVRLYLLQRLSALIMIPLVFGHLGLMIYAVQDGLSANEILSRTKGSFFWALFYGIFVVAVSIHSSIGLRGIIFETIGIKGSMLNFLGWAIFLSLMYLGIYSVYAVTKL